MIVFYLESILPNLEGRLRGKAEASALSAICLRGKGAQLKQSPL